MFKYPDLHTAFAELQKQSALYSPTSFWEDASKKLANEFEQLGVENFRRGPLARSYFVPTYGPPALGLLKEQVALLTQTFNSHYPDHKRGRLTLDAYLSGHLNALADYRVLMAANSEPDVFGLTSFSESPAGNPIEQFTFDAKHYSRSALNYILGLSLLKQHVDLSSVKTVLGLVAALEPWARFLERPPKRASSTSTLIYLQPILLLSTI